MRGTDLGKADVVTVRVALATEAGRTAGASGGAFGVLAGLLDPWAPRAGVEALDVALSEGDGGLTLTARFEVRDGAAARAAVSAEIAALGRPVRPRDAADGLRLMVAARLDREGVEVRDAVVAGGPARGGDGGCGRMAA